MLYLFAHLGMASRVATLTTVATPHCGTLPADHLAQVGQLAGALSFDQKAFFADLCRGLARLGY